MTPSAKYVIPAAWLLLFVYRLAFGASDQFSLWALRVLTVLILVMGCIAVAHFVARGIGSWRRGDPVFTKSTLRGLLLGGLVVGLVLRVIAWDPGSEGVLAWVGGTILIVSIVGLVGLRFLKERAERSKRTPFYFNPHWKYGLLLICVLALVLQGAIQPEGTFSTLNAGAFWIAVIALIVQAVGRLILRRRQTHGPSAATGHSA